MEHIQMKIGYLVGETETETKQTKKARESDGILNIQFWS